MKTCVICGDETKHPNYDFCEKCFNSSIQELEARYRRREASTPRKEEEALSVSEPLAGNTHQ